MSRSNGLNPDNQKTIKGPFSLSGIGIHSGKRCEILFRPADPDSGINFIYQGKKIPALVSQVTKTDRGTSLSGIQVVEHILAAAFGLGIDNLVIELSSPEPPILDGSALPYVEGFLGSGIVEQFIKKKVLVINDEILINDDYASLKLVPFNGFSINFMINFSYIGKQSFDFSDNFAFEIAPARTFGLIEEIEGLKTRGLAKGASLDNALAIGREGYINPPRFSNEPVRHKILDLIGDLALVGRPLRGKIFAVRSGHKLNIELARRLFELC